MTPKKTVSKSILRLFFYSSIQVTIVTTQNMPFSLRRTAMDWEDGIMNNE